MIKAIIPVAGAGTLLRPHTHTMPKPLIPVAGKPILGHIIDHLIDAGIQDFTFVIGYLGEKIEEYVRRVYEGRIRIDFVVQSPRLGLGHAIWTAREAFRDADEVFIHLGDTIFDADLRRMIESPDSIVGVQEVEDPRSFGVAQLDEQGFIHTLTEKPRIPKSNLALVGLYKLRHTGRLIEALETLIGNQEKGETGEFHLTDGLMKMVIAGEKICTLPVDNWFDCGKKESLLETNQILLERRTETPAYQFGNSVILPPVYIAEGCTIEDSIIGPYVAIAENAVIRHSIVRNSILGAWSQLDSIVLDGSVIGNDASLRGTCFSVNIGDNTEIDFGE